MTTETAPAAINHHSLLEAPVTKEQARPALEQLRAERVAGRLTEADYLRRSDYLARLDAGEQVEAPKLYLTQEEQFSKQYDEQMQAPEHAYHNLPQPQGLSENAAMNFHSSVADVFIRGDIPQHLARPILEAVFRAHDEMNGLSERDRQSRLESTANKLREAWGDDYQARLDRVNDHIGDMVDGDERIAGLFDRRPWLFHASVEAMTYLDRVATHRATKEKP